RCDNNRFEPATEQRGENRREEHHIDHNAVKLCQQPLPEGPARALAKRIRPSALEAACGFFVCQAAFRVAPQGCKRLVATDRMPSLFSFCYGHSHISFGYASAVL